MGSERGLTVLFTFLQRKRNAMIAQRDLTWNIQILQDCLHWEFQSEGAEWSLRGFPDGQGRRLKRRGFDPWVGNGNQLQYSCLKTSMDRGDWWAIVQGVTTEFVSGWARTNDSSGCLLHPLKWSWSTLRIPSQVLKWLYDLKACRLSQQREISTVVSVVKHSCMRKGSPLSNSSTLLEPSYHWYPLCQKHWAGAERATCLEYLMPQTQIPTLISSWKANRNLEYVMSETELIISTPLILKACYSPLYKCYPPSPSTQQVRQITWRMSLNPPFPQSLNPTLRYILLVLLQNLSQILPFFSISTTIITMSTTALNKVISTGMKHEYSNWGPHSHSWGFLLSIFHSPNGVVC